MHSKFFWTFGARQVLYQLILDIEWNFHLKHDASLSINSTFSSMADNRILSTNHMYHVIEAAIDAGD